MQIVFWLSVGFVLYVYAGYPALLAMCVRLGAGPASRGPAYRANVGRVSGGNVGRACGGDVGRASRSRPADLPPVTVIIAARNEGRRLPGRIDNILASDYPRDRIQIIVASDGSTDETTRALAPYRERITLLQLPATGKAAALNAAVLHATHPILVFADARQRFAADAIRRLVAGFSDARVGAVSGELIIDCEGGPSAVSRSTVGDGVGAYWKYEKWIRRHEATVSSTVGVSGAIYAMRRWLWQPLPADAILDDVLGPMRLVQRGYRVLFEPSARAYDRAASDAGTELRRKTRTLAGNFQLLRYEPWLLVPHRNPAWLQFVSHKLARLLVPYALIATFVTSAALAWTGPVYAAALGAQVFFYALAGYGALLDHRERVQASEAVEVMREAA